jgi:hypothetical protein
LTHGARRDGTRRFHAYAAAYVIVQGQRFTLALTFVWAADRLVDGLRRLRQRLRPMGVKTKLLLLDRQFSTVEIIHLMCNSFLPRVRAYAVFELRWHPLAIAQSYGRRFGIESSYRQMRQGRARTSSPSAVLRLWLAGLALDLGKIRGGFPDPRRGIRNEASGLIRWAKVIEDRRLRPKEIVSLQVKQLDRAFHRHPIRETSRNCQGVGWGRDTFSPAQ